MTATQQLDQLTTNANAASQRKTLAEVAYNALCNSAPLRIKVQVANRYKQAEADYLAAVAAIDAYTDEHEAPEC